MTTELATKPDRAAQVQQVFRWIVEGQSEQDIVEAVEAKWPDSKGRPLILAAVKRIAESASPEQDTVRGWCIEATRHTYAQALAAGDFGAALRAIKQLAAFALEK